jgi:GT2 family glycosyltransferase
MSGQVHDISRPFKPENVPAWRSPFGHRSSATGTKLVKVFAMVVTYNRKALLEECLAALFAQTRPVDGVVVIDNASTDGTEEWLRANWASKVHCYTLSRNIGGAGGFNAGLRLAYKQDTDFIWVMDDDVFPDPDALEKLLAASDLLAARGIPSAYLVSSVRSSEGEVTNVPAIDQRKNKDGYQNWPFLLQFGLIPINRGTFTSILLARAQLAEHGLPIRQMFIWGEDTDYTMRITKKHPGYIVGASRAVHGRTVAGVARIETEANPTRIQYHRLRVRNEMYISRQHYSLLRTLARQVLTGLKLLLKGQFYKASIIAQGTWAGLFFNPSIEAAATPIEQLDPAVKAYGGDVPKAPARRRASTSSKRK